MDKEELRKKLYRKRTRAFKHDQQNGTLLSSRLISMAGSLIKNPVPHLSISSTIIAGYIPIGSEIDPRPLMTVFHEAGALLCVPEVVDLDLPLRFRQWKPGDLLISGHLGTLQPMETAQIVEPNLMFVPLVGVDAKGVRLGQGGGFYDRTIGPLRALGMTAFGVAFDEQLIDELQCEDHDEYLDGLISPSCCKIWDENRKVKYLKQA